jgi:ABC-type branched-subunit amino acid transport system substrate-binding protein
MAAALILCLVFGATVAADEIVVGMSAAFKGPSRALGSELYRGSMAYLEHVNRKGGVHGRKVTIKAYDDGYNPVPAIENTIRLIDRDNVFLLFNYVGTPTVTRILPLLKTFSSRHVHLFFPFTGAEPHRQPPYGQYVFNLRASYRDETEGLVENFMAAGRTRIGVFYQADAYGRSGWDGVRRALATTFGHKMVGEAAYRRGADYGQRLTEQVEILRRAEPDAIISIGAYGACAAFVRDARDAGLEAPIANVSFVGSESLAALLIESSRASGKDYTRNLINSQVVPSYEDGSLPAVREYREMMERYRPMPPPELIERGYRPLPHSFISLEGFLNAKLLVEVLKKMGPAPSKSRVRETVESIRDLDLGMGAPVVFGPERHQGLDQVYYTTLEEGRFVPVSDWKRWAK